RPGYERGRGSGQGNDGFADRRGGAGGAIGIAVVLSGQAISAGRQRTGGQGSYSVSQRAGAEISRSIEKVDRSRGGGAGAAGRSDGGSEGDRTPRIDRRGGG